MESPAFVQRELFESRNRTVDEVAGILRAGLAGNVSVAATRNRASLLSVKFDPFGGARVRLHEAFLGAPRETLEFLGRFIRTRDKRYWRKAAAYVRQIEPEVSAGARRPGRLSTAGTVYDLASIKDEVNREFFSGRVECRIGWGRSVRRPRRRRTIRFGSWNAPSHTIRIHRLLDDARVPGEFIKYIVFHEMLHAVVPRTVSGGRRVDHGQQFRTLEKSYPNIREMKRIAGDLLRRL